jgi:hypothetical protein
MGVRFAPFARMPTLGAKYAPKMGHPDLWFAFCDTRRARLTAGVELKSGGMNGGCGAGYGAAESYSDGHY